MHKPVLIETSARHAHLSRADLDILFGEGYELTPAKPLSQPGQFACAERVAVVGPKSTFPKVSILGPARPASQVEFAITDAIKLGVYAPVRESGDVAGSAPCKLVGPQGEVELAEGVIVAKRHIHAAPADAEAYGLEDRQVARVRCESDGRSLIFDDVVVRVHPNFSLAMHIDTDESNAGMVRRGTIGEILN
ncbi:MAG: phosphate propanoyltransferase [Oscillospiraceae bacterium]|jgi:putative phosphotransacetylase|nr:phosphate propanoyltransferase [Oscillospiraceae bacterium]